jgi:hypothetical protein
MLSSHRGDAVGRHALSWTRSLMLLANVVRELLQTVINGQGADRDAPAPVKLFARNAGVAIVPQKLRDRKSRLPIGLDIADVPGAGLSRQTAIRSQRL